MAKNTLSVPSNLKSKTSNPQSLRVLMVEDSEDDALLIVRELKKGGYNPVYERAETAAAMKKAFKEKPWDIILCDYTLPKFSVAKALALLRETNIDIPFLLVSGTIGEETAVECMRLGAQDYIMKNSLSRLCPTIKRELEEAEIRRKRKQAESQREAAFEALRQSEERYRTILEDIVEGYYETDIAGNFTFFNDSMCQIWGYPKEELMGMNNRQYTDKENTKKLFQAFSEVYRTGKPAKGFDWQIIRKDGTKRIGEASVSLLKDSSGKPIGFRGITRDVTARKQAEESLRRSEEKYRGIIEGMQEGCFENDLAGNFTFVNDTLCRDMGYSREELIGKNNRRYTDEETAKKIYQIYNRIYKTGEPIRGIELESFRKNGIKGFAELSVSLMRDAEGKPIGFQGIAKDITERKRAEEALRESEDKYKSLVNNVPDIIFTIDLEGKITFVSQRWKEILGYESAETINMNILNFVQEEDRQRAMESIQKGLTGEKITSFQIPIITKSGEKLFFECSFSRVYKDVAVVGAQGTAVDITGQKQAEEERKQSFERMRKVLGATVHSISQIVEMRDPYTSGHQQRVSDLARSIATEMGLSADRRDFIRTASSIHDIGKISIPSEILIKPTKLTDLEFSLIKTHSQSGYDILKDIEFPWPVANVILQHHERMDGSGYPQGLKGDDILLEARILAIADVVESMASHRPYRPALGIEVALEEIEKNKGNLYDNTVVDACLKLFRGKGYQLKGT
jgi:PAS domain S-box-containing protein